MPTFSTPTPIDLAIDLPAGRIEVIASEREDTIVTIAPSTPSKTADARAAQGAEVTFADGRLTVTGARPRPTWLGPTGSIDVMVELPALSRVSADTSAGAVRTTGPLGATRVKSGLGSIDIDSSADLWIKAAHGNASIGEATGAVEVTTDHGQVRIGAVDGDVIARSSHGSITIDHVTGDVDVKLSYGDLHAGRTEASVAASTAYGAIHLREVSGGSIQLDSGFGEITVGVREGVPAWLDLSSKSGHVRNQLEAQAAPTANEPSVAVRARTGFGDITITRAR